MAKDRRVLVVSGHPGAGSLTEALAETAAGAARASGAEVRLVRLSALRFDGDLTDGYRTRKDLEPDLVRLADDIAWCSDLLLVHPLWWGSAPARLKGLFDRLFLPGIAFRTVPGRALPDPLWTGRTARVLILSDTPRWYMWLAYRDAWLHVLRRQILGFVGLKVRQIRMVGPVRDATPARIAAWHDAARALARG
jgi:NAD(P)H dehydrogenase (quinone)